MDKAQKVYPELNKGLLCAVLGLAFWPVLVWYVARTLDLSDEPWGLLSLATAVLLLVLKAPSYWLKRGNEAADGRQPLLAESIGATMAGILILLVYIATYRVAPQLVQSVLLVLAIWYFIVEKFPMPSRSGIFGLLLLALPVIPSLNFYAGYPVRFIAAAGTTLLLGILGFPIKQEGTIVSVNSHLISIDAPCSGIHMLWTEAYAVMLLASLFGLDFRKTILLALSACILIPIDNVLRASTLIVYDMLGWRYHEPILSQLEPLVHVAAGLFCFCLVTGVIAWLAHKLSVAGPDIMKPLGSSFKNLNQQRFANRAIVILCIVSAALPLFARPTKGSDQVGPPPSWPAQINGENVTPIESLKEEQAFASDFPGRMKRYTDGTNAYFVRCVYKDTRQLHPSRDCFRGLGYAVEPHAVVVGKDGKMWSCFEATKSEQKYLVMERIYDPSGKSWTDVSEWYWSACGGQSRGPWLAITIAKPLTKEIN